MATKFDIHDIAEMQAAGIWQDTGSEVPDYVDARNVAYRRRTESNLARAYIGLHDIVREIIAVMDNEQRTPEEMLLLERANDVVNK